jgi:hypothetical protein
MAYVSLIAGCAAVYVLGCMLIDALCDALKPPRW